MSRLILAPVFLTLAASLPGIAAITPPSAAPTAIALSIDGVAAGTASVWSGGDRFLHVAWPVAGSPAASAQPELAPLEFELSPAQVGPWLPMLQEFAASSGAGHRLVVAEQFSSGARGPAVAYTDAKIQELTVPRLSEGGVLRFKVSAGDRAATTETVPLNTGTTNRTYVAGTVAVSGMAGMNRADVLPIVLRAGSGGIQLMEPLTVKVPDGGQQPFQNWLDQTLGGAASATTVTVSIPKTLGGTDAWLTLTFANTLPLRVVRETGTRMFRVELASTQISISGTAPAAPAGASTTPPDTGTAPAPTTTPEPATPEPTTPAPADTGTPAPVPAPTPAPTIPAVITELPAPSSKEIALGGTIAPAPVDPALAAIKQPSAATKVPATTKIPSTGGSRADQGLRDPAEFPRPTGLTRVSFSNSEYTHRSVESADYEGRMEAGEMWKTYRKTVTSAGWTLEGMNESGTSPETVMILSSWRSGRAYADLRLYAVKGGGVKVSLTVTTDQ